VSVFGSRPFLAEHCLCDACSCHETEAARGVGSAEPPEPPPPSYLDVHAEEIDSCFGQPNLASIIDAVAEMAASSAAAAGDDSKHWSVRAAQALSSASPTSLAVSWASPSCVRSILTEIYLCHACSCHEVEDGNARTGHTRGAAARRGAAHAGRVSATHMSPPPSCHRSRQATAGSISGRAG
jgi:hypothetical protein